MKIKKNFLPSIIFLSVLILGLNAYADGINDLYGTWTVDYERSIEKAEKNPKYSAEELKNMPEIVKKMMATMKVRLRQSEMVFIKEGEEKSYPFSLVAESKNTARIEYNTGTKQYFLNFTLTDKEHMYFKSSGSDDMDNYIWKRTDIGA
ncbi:MAG: hypothetical protein ABIC68_06510 [Candidatus Omnitrophota bacterium]